MSSDNESLFDLFVFETTQNIEQLEQKILINEQAAAYSKDMVDEIFRVMHTIKGSAAMMQFDGMSEFAHKIEDLFSILRENHEIVYDAEELSDIVLAGIDFIKAELSKLTAGQQADGDSSALKDRIHAFAEMLKNDKAGASADHGENTKKDEHTPAGFGKQKAGEYRYKAVFFFEDGCMMENIRAFDIVHKLEEFAADISHIPADIIQDDKSSEFICKNGFTVQFSTDKSYEELHKFFTRQVFLKNLQLEEVKAAPEKEPAKQNTSQRAQPEQKPVVAPVTGSIISVNVAKLDKLMDLMGELVIAEAMVLHNPEIKKMQLDSFQRAARQLRKITGEMQDVVMSARMVPVTSTFRRMNRIVRDMNRKLDKNVELRIIGEETEVDKNIIEHIGDPLMHLVRNSLDHGIESTEERRASGKPEHGTVTLEAKNDGSDVVLIVRDDGKGLDKEQILQRAEKRGLLTKPASQMSAKEIYALLFVPGFSTKEQVTEYSGRGVGLDVVVKNVEAVGGRVVIESVKGKGTAFIMRFPLTLAIVDGMNIRVGKSLYTIPVTDIRASFRAAADEAFFDLDDNEMIMVRDKCYPIIRLNKLFGVQSDVEDLDKGILVMVENGDNTICLFADELLGQQDVVVKAMPKYIKGIKGLSGCTLLGDGQISLIIDVGGIIAGL